MKFEVLKPVEVDIKYLDVFFGGRFYPEDLEINGEVFEDLTDIFERYPSLKNFNPDGYEDLWLRIDVETGEVVNWPHEEMDTCYVENIKLVDEGIYVLVDSNIKQIGIYRDYVPKCLEIDEDAWGDYLEFTIENNGKIKNWSFTQEHLNEIMKMIKINI